jgi:hypothetical protein
MTESTLMIRLKSIILSIDTLVRRGVLALAMDDPATIDKEIAEFTSVAERLREDRAKLDTGLAVVSETLDKLRAARGLPPLSSSARSNAVPDPRDSATAANAPGPVSESPNSGSESETVDAPGSVPGTPPVSPMKVAEKPRFRECPICLEFFKPSIPHPQGPSHRPGDASSDNHFLAAQLDIAFGKDGWERDETEDEASDKLQGQDEPAQAVSAKPRYMEPELMARKRGLRPDTKKYRVFIATAKPLQNGPTYIDDILKILPSEWFEEVQSDRRTNLSNIFSQLKSKDLLVSDNHGNWSLPRWSLEP